MTCTTCNGTARLPNGAPCADCGKEGAKPGRMPMRRCPRSLVDRSTLRAWGAWGILRRYGTWPVPGGALDQSATFLWFVGEFDAEIDRARAEEPRE